MYKIKPLKWIRIENPWEGMEYKYLCEFPLELQPANLYPPAQNELGWTLIIGNTTEHYFPSKKAAMDHVRNKWIKCMKQGLVRC